MKKILILSLSLFVFTLSGFSQPGEAAKPAAPQKAASAETLPGDIAKATLAAHGGDKLKKLQALVTKGSVDMNVFGQSMPGAFSTAVNGDKYYFEINSVAQSLKQVYDGQQTYSSIQGFVLPPLTTLGFPVLQRIGDTGYVITALPELKRKKRGFRITTPEGYYTDFYVDEKTSLLKGYESSYSFGDRTVTTAVEVDEMQTVEGLVVPKKYSQRFDLASITAYATFKTKDILVNPQMDASAFAIPK